MTQPRPQIDVPVVHAIGCDISVCHRNLRSISERLNEAFKELEAQYNNTDPMSAEASELKPLLLTLSRIEARVSQGANLIDIAVALKHFRRPAAEPPPIETRQECIQCGRTMTVGQPCANCTSLAADPKPSRVATVHTPDGPFRVDAASCRVPQPSSVHGRTAHG